MRRRFRIYSLVAQSQPSTGFQKPKKNPGPRSVYLRGLRGVEPAPGLVPIDSDVDSSPCASCSCTWLLQYGFSSVHDADSAGWTPLHYAVLGGNVTIVQDLLELKADVNRRTRLPQPQIGALPFMSSLDICMLFGQNDAAPVASLGTNFHVYYDIGIPSGICKHITGMTTLLILEVTPISPFRGIIIRFVSPVKSNYYMPWASTRSMWV